MKKHMLWIDAIVLKKTVISNGILKFFAELKALDTLLETEYNRVYISNSNVMEFACRHFLCHLSGTHLKSYLTNIKNFENDFW